MIQTHWPLYTPARLLLKWHWAALDPGEDYQKLFSTFAGMTFLFQYRFCEPLAMGKSK